MTSWLDIVLPIRATEGATGSDLDRVVRGLLPSLHVYGYEKFLNKINIISPDAEIDLVKKRVTGVFPDLNYRFLSDSELSVTMGYSQDDFSKVPSWHRQQLIKLAAVANSSAGAVLVLDSDIVALRPLAELNLPRPPWPYQPMGTERFRGWFMTSASVIGKTLDDFDPGQLSKAMGVTPEFLNPKIVRDLIAYLAAKPQSRGWGSTLMESFQDYDRTWTEYSLYWLWYISHEEYAGQYKPTVIYRFIETEDAVRTDIFDNPQTFFAVLQSTKITTAMAQPVYDFLHAASGSRQ